MDDVGRVPLSAKRFSSWEEISITSPAFESTFRTGDSEGNGNEKIANGEFPSIDQRAEKRNESESI
jgi:hypothetical protein